MSMSSPVHSIDRLASDVKRLLIPRVLAADVHSPAFRDAFDAPEQHDRGIEHAVSEALIKFCAENDVQPENVISCLSMIRLGWCVLHAGSPTLMMGYSTAHDRFIASMDSDIPDGWRDLSESKATLLLLLLASEVQQLPVHADDWGVIRFRDPMLLEFESSDHTSIKRYQSYLAGERDGLDEYEQKLARSFFAVRDFMRLA
ncbi:hypothetical protein HT749_31960 [Burkholderia cepacia]|uniref:hypothetical protein n=1 Tax=Burkholderia cepacia complex TaxID=87882 RepID=UPI00157AB377|nr:MULTISPECIES: hypothetical protein [Burkholderia cepacia complex]MBR8218295.1 hypothetical protein [Burkholderia vietnamiensis]NTX48007.1 hypothetical protein [Burkholderia cepacia]